MAKKKGGKGRRPPPRSGSSRPASQRTGGQRPASQRPGGPRPAGQKPAGASRSAEPDDAEASPEAGTQKGGPQKGGAQKDGAQKRPNQKATGAGKARAEKTSAPPSGSARARPRGSPTRAERLAAAQAARRRKTLRTRILVVSLVAVAVAGILTLVLGNRKAAADVKKQLQAGSCRYDEQSDGDNGTGNNHVPNPTYKVNPPAGGNHLATPASAGTYTEQSAPPDGEIVHSMEHGYVVLWYQPSLDPKQLDSLTKVADKYQRDVLVVPRASLPRPVAATAWHHRLLCGDADAKALDLFVRTYRNQGPEKIPH